MASRSESLESTALLLARVRSGDGPAREALCRRFLPLLQRWAHGRLPARARGLADTGDLVQVTLVRALNRLGEFEPRHEGAFLAYLRRALLNALRDEIRRSVRRPSGFEPDESVPDPRPSGVEEAIGRETLERYEAALGTLTEEQREAVILRIEFGYTHEQVAAALGKPTANAARMVVSRALVRIAKVMGEYRT